MIKIKVEEESILEIGADAIVNPANSYGYMGGGIAGVIKKKGGVEIEMEAVSFAPIPIGHAVITTAGKLTNCQKVIHSPTMEQPSQQTNINYVEEAVNAALQCAEDNGIEVIAMPGMGTGVGKVPVDKAAKTMVDVIKKFKEKCLKEVILVDANPDMVKAWEKVLE